MFNFFVGKENQQDNSYSIYGSDYNHIINVLRMKKGDKFIVNCEGKGSLCELSEIYTDYLLCNIIEEKYNDTQLPLKIYLFQGLPKGDKMELIIQKCVELGVYEIIPVEMENCVVKLDDKKKKSKLSRWQSISESAAKQSKCNIIPEISPVLSYNEALEKAEVLDCVLVPYECAEGMLATKNALKSFKSGMSVGIFIGSEGGFSKKEITKAREKEFKIISLGKRILRTETAAITAVGMCMLYGETELSND